MRSIIITALAAVTLTGLLLVGGWLLLNPAGPPLATASFSTSTLSPNADGDNDLTRLRYTLRRPATLSIFFLDAQARRYDFRALKARDAGEHQVDFSGIVAPFRLPEDTFAGELLARVLPNGEYQWVVEARDAQGTANQITGSLIITNADTILPELLNFTASPAIFSPNQDGVNDRETINVYLTKNIASDGLRLFLIDEQGARLPISERDALIKPGERGLHTYDYDGGIDQGANPPSDGNYTVVAEVEDRLGQRLRLTTALTIKDSGLPRADILKGEVQFSATTLVLGDTLYFTLTIENYGTAPLRTSGPPAGTVYASMSANGNQLGFYEESGAWRVGIDCDTCVRDYPWRWALGTPETLHASQEDGRTYYYLAPGERATITGGIVLDEIIESRNPQYFWAGLIHEDVEISTINNRVDPQQVEILKP